MTNVQETITYAFTKQGVTLTHPSGVKVFEAKADVQAEIDRATAAAAVATKQAADLTKDKLDVISASLVSATP